MILLAGSDLSTQTFEDVDEAPLLAAFERAGLEAQYRDWDDADTDWAGADLVIIRATWDYTRRVPEFLDWLERVGATTTILNPPALVRWNLDKAYLGQLEEAGVPVVPTVYVRAPEEWEQARAAVGTPELVIKPTVSAGSDLTGRFERDDPAAGALVEQVLEAGKVAMVQPYQASVTEQGEVAMVYVDGRFSHALRKGPILDAGGTFLGGEYTEVVDPLVPDAAQREVADRVLAAQARLSGVPEAPLYARVDLVRADDGSPTCLELELVEPSLFFDTDPDSADRFVAAAAARLS